MSLFQSDAYGHMQPAAHSRDPATSHEAAKRHTESGARGRNAALVMFLVREHPASTAVELWELAGDAIRATLGEMQEVRRRLTDLEFAGKVKKGEQRACTIKKNKMLTWLLQGE